MKRIRKGKQILQSNPELLPKSYLAMVEASEFFRSLFKKYNFLLTLTATSCSPYVNEIGAEDESAADSLNIPISLAKLPSMSIPLSYFDVASDLSIQIVAPYKKDLTIFEVLKNDIIKRHLQYH